MPEPTETQLKEYAEQLPHVYRAILESFAAIAPKRRFGQGILLSSIVRHYSNHPSMEQEEVQEAIENLIAEHFLNYEDSLVVPTPLGEKLIAAVTGRQVPQGIPKLPTPSWA